MKPNEIYERLSEGKLSEKEAIAGLVENGASQFEAEEIVDKLTGGDDVIEEIEAGE